MPPSSREVYREDLRHLNTSSDSEVLLNVFASELQRAARRAHRPADIFAAVSAVYRRVRGGYAVVSMIVGHGLLGFRDPFGIRPLVLGRRETPHGTEYMLASESVALDMLGFELMRDVGAGRGRVHRRARARCTRSSARPIRAAHAVHLRVRLSRAARLDHRRHLGATRRGCAWASGWPTRSRASAPDHDIDVVIPIPDTAAPRAMQVAQLLGVKYREGFVKNRYIGRTFIMPGQEQRRSRCARSST